MFSRVSYPATFAAVLLASSVSAHIIMNEPVPINAPESGPLTGASQYPCQKDKPYKSDVAPTELTVGTEYPLSFNGSAVHGGGSCQLSFTTDTEPTESSDFRVIKSWIGGCPLAQGAGSLKYSIPAEITNGKGTLAWTWIAKSSGVPEFYMNCAPVTVSGGSDDASALSSLPEMFKANIGGVPGFDCKTLPPNGTPTEVDYPNPGKDVERTAQGVKPSCGGSEDSSGGSPPVADTPPATSAAAGNDGQYTPPAAAAPFPPPANFAPGASSAAPVAPAPTTLATVPSPAPSAALPSAQVPVLPVSPTAAAPIATPTAAPTPVVPSPGAGSVGTSCSSDGAVMCNGTSQFGLCNHGSVVWQPVAAGTHCVNGAVVRKRMVRGLGEWGRK